MSTYAIPFRPTAHRRAILRALAPTRWVALLFLLLYPHAIQAQTSSVPPLMNYQGKLTKPDGSPVEDGQYKVRFSIHDALTGGNERWFQTMDPVLVRNGVFSVLLGSGNPLSSEVFSGTRYLEIKVGDLAPLSPRQPIVSVGYSFVAQKAEVANTSTTVLDGAITTSKIASEAVTDTKLGSSSVKPQHLASDPDSFIKVTAGRYSFDSLGNTVGLGKHLLSNRFGNLGPTIDLAIGDGDTGFEWFGDGNLQWVSDGSRRLNIERTGQSIFYGPLYVDSRGFGGLPALDLAIGDSDTGIRWMGDGAFDILVNGLLRMEFRFDRVSIVNAAKTAVVDTPSHGRRTLYAVEAADVRFTDEGIGTIRNGYARVRLDPVFLETIEGEHIIHLTSYAKDSLYVSKVAPTYFEVRSVSGKGTGSFAWRLSAKRRGFADRRLELQPPTDASGGSS